jgi:hypothetical protein
MERVYTPGQTAANMKVDGAKARCTGRAHSLGQMGACFVVNLFMTKSKALENTFGLMVAATGVIGKKANSTVRVFFSQDKATRSPASGKMASVSEAPEKKTLALEVLNDAASNELLGYCNSGNHFNQ